jgi:DNA polymerase I
MRRDRGVESKSSLAIEGWLLDVYPGQKEGEMVAWVKKEGGETVRLTDCWHNAIYVAADKAESLHRLAEWASLKLMVFSCEYVLKRERVFEHEERQVLKLVLRQANEAEKLAKEVEGLEVLGDAFRIYNADLMPAQTYFFEKNLFTLAWVHAEQTGDGTIRWQLLDSPMEEEYQIPPLRKASIKVSILSSKRIPRFVDPIDSITVTQGDDVREIDKGDEREKILGLVEVIRELDPDIVFVERGDDFTTHYLAERAHVNGISGQLVLGRDPIPIRRMKNRGTSYFAYGRILRTPTSHQLYGRINLDADNFVYTEAGLDGLFEIVRLCRMPLHKGSRASIGRCLSSLQAYIAFQDNLLVPWKPTRAEIPKTAETLLLGDRGGFIYEPRIGMHEQVGEIDFTSLFPFIMKKYNISAETIFCKCCPDSRTVVPDVGFLTCEKHRGVIPRSLEPILSKRVSYKRKKKQEKDPELKRVYEARVDSLKGILVCSFGYLSYRNAKFGLIDCHIAVCAYAREILLRTSRIAESRGFEVIHGIVDSLWVKKRGATEQEFEDLCEEVEREIGLPISFEGIYRWIAFLPSRMHEDVPVLNRYFGIFQDGEMKVRGIELRRRDTTRLVSKCQLEMLQALSKAETLTYARSLIPGIIEIVEKYADFIRSGEVPLEDLVIVNGLSKDFNQYSSRSQVHVGAAKQLADEGLELMAGQSVSYVVTDYKSRIPEERARPVELLDQSTRYDPARYLEMLVRGAASILQPFGIAEEELKDAVGPGAKGSGRQLALSSSL